MGKARLPLRLVFLNGAVLAGKGFFSRLVFSEHTYSIFRVLDKLRGSCIHSNLELFWSIFRRTEWWIYSGMISPLRSIIIFRKELSLPSDFLGTLIISSRVVLNSRRSGRRSDGPTRPTRLPLNPSTIHMLSDRFAILSNNPIILKQLD